MPDAGLQVSVGRVVRRRRARLGHSQEAFADHVGVHRTYMGGVERGERNVSLKNLDRIAAALGVPLSKLLAEAERDAGPRASQKGRRPG